MSCLMNAVSNNTMQMFTYIKLITLPKKLTDDYYPKESRVFGHTIRQSEDEILLYKAIMGL